MSYLCSSGIRSWFRIWFFITYMANKKVYIETYGCQMNVNDTEVIFSILKKAGYDRTENMDEADVIMANTCSVRDNAEQRIWGRIRPVLWSEASA